MGDCEKARIKLTYLIEDKTTGFIETDVYITNILPEFVRNTIDPLFKMAMLHYLPYLISAEKELIPKIRKWPKLTRYL